MEQAKVFFTDMRCPTGVSLLTKMDRLIEAAGFDSIDFTRKFAAIKVHFGEPGNLAFLRPNFSKVVADRVKKNGGIPFLTDCNTLYVGRRKNAVEHMDAAMEQGFSPLSTGCQVIIGDGLKGTDDIEVPVENGKYCQTARIGRAVMDADIFLSLNHFKGHEVTGFGGALKNIGMGCGSRAGKMQMHNEGKPRISQTKCKGCRVCARYCAQSAIFYKEDGKAGIDYDKCVGCGRCIGTCNFDAISNWGGIEENILNSKIVEYVKAVVAGRPNFHINVVQQVSPYCDCHNESDAAVVPDIGIFASFDPVALDLACARAVIAAPPIPNSCLSQSEDTGRDHFGRMHPRSNWESQIEHGEAIGLGTSNYELITL